MLGFKKPLYKGKVTPTNGVDLVIDSEIEFCGSIGAKLLSADVKVVSARTMSGVKDVQLMQLTYSDTSEVQTAIVFQNWKKIREADVVNALYALLSTSHAKAIAFSSSLYDIGLQLDADADTTENVAGQYKIAGATRVDRADAAYRICGTVCGTKPAKRAMMTHAKAVNKRNAESINQAHKQFKSGSAAILPAF